LVTRSTLRAVVLVEGLSDRYALEALARRRGRDLAADGVEIVVIGGAQALGRILGTLAAAGGGPRIAGLCDAGEEETVRRALERAGLEPGRTRAGLAEVGFHVCVEDLEDELIRAAGADTVEAIAEEQGDLRAFRTLQKQAAWRARSREQQLRRWLGSGGRRKLRYAPLLVDALELDRIPEPLDAVLAAAYGERRSAR
jgi:hypothetical protein